MKTNGGAALYASVGGNLAIVNGTTSFPLISPACGGSAPSNAVGVSGCANPTGNNATSNGGASTGRRRRRGRRVPGPGATGGSGGAGVNGGGIGAGGRPLQTRAPEQAEAEATQMLP